jgi:transposase
MTVAPWIVSDELWELVEPLLPVKERRFLPGPEAAARAAGAAGDLVRVAHRDLVDASASRARLRGDLWRRLDEWQKANVWERLHQLLLARLRAAGEIEWSRAVVDASHVQAKRRGSETGPSPVDRARNGSKHHLLVEGGGIPLAWALTGGNRHDSTQLIALIDRVPPVRGKVGRPRRRPDRVTGDRAYDYPSRRRELRQRGIKAEIARRNTEHGSALGRYRWVVERTFAWLLQFKRLLVRYEPRRHPRSLPRDRLLPRLLPPTQERLIVKGALRGIALPAKATNESTRESTGLSPSPSACCSFLQREPVLIAASFSSSRFATAFPAGLLIPRSKVRILHGPSTKVLQTGALFC